MNMLQAQDCAPPTRFRALAAAREIAHSDEFLLTQIANGDQHALRILIGRHEVRVFRFVLRMVGERRLAEDVVSDTFLAVWQNAGSFEGRASVATWMLAIARYKALTARGRKTTSEESITDELAGSLADDVPGPEDNIVRRDTAATVRKCISALPKHHAELMDLVYYHEKSIHEVAMIVGIPENTVKSRMFLARRKLAELLMVEGVDRA